MKSLKTIFGFRSSDSPTAEELLAQGEEYCEQQQWQDAVAVLEKAAHIQPKLPRIHLALLVAFGGMMNRDAALEHYKILKKLDSRLAKQLEDTPAFIMLSRLGGVIKL